MKITGGIYNGRKIDAPDSKIARPTLSKIRMSIFNTLYSMLGSFDDKTFLDMFGGSGIMGLEALSRGFKFVTVFEQNNIAAEIIKKNYTTLNLAPDLYIGDSLKLIKNFDKKFNVAYIDPPYMSGIYEECLGSIRADIVILEHTAQVDMTDYKIVKQKKYGDKYLSFLTC